jgi:MFS family permease
MPDTVAGLFRTRTEAETALRNLKEAGFGPDRLSMATPRRGRRGHYGLKVLIGIVAGTLLGALIGAIVTGMVPGFHPLVAGNMLALFLLAAVAGAATGGVAGGLISMSAAGDRALYYEQEVESGRFLITVTGGGLVEASRILRASGAMEAAPVEAPLHPESG